MKASILTVAVAALALSPAAFAESFEEITVAVSYDRTALATEEGAASVLASIKSQASDACMSTSAIGAMKQLDRTCFDEVVTSATSKILEQQEIDGLKTAPNFARLASRQVADISQR